MFSDYKIYIHTQVADTAYNLYIGIKQSGAFQHSSFLHGGRVSAAGLIKVHNGKLKCKGSNPIQSYHSYQSIMSIQSKSYKNELIYNGR